MPEKETVNNAAREPQSTVDAQSEAMDALLSSMAAARGSSSKYESDSLAWSIGDTKQKIIDAAAKSAAVKASDHYGNSLSSSGTEDRVASFEAYGFSADTLQWPLWLALYNDSWVFKRAIDKPAQDMVQAGFMLQNGRDCSEAMALYSQLKGDVCDLFKWGALFGGAAAVMLFSGIKLEQMASPMQKTNLKGRKMKLYVTDRWYGLSPSYDDLVGDMGDPDFGKPKWYEVTMADGKQWKIHHSYVLRYEHRGAPNLVKKGYLQGWGYAEGSHIINELARDDQLKSSITSLVNKSLIEVVKMAGMRGVFMGTDKGNEAQLQKRLEMVNWGRTYNSLTFLDKDDEYQQYQLTGLSGLAELLEKNMWLISSALEMQGVLFGGLKGGLSQESDAWQRYSQTIRSRAEALARPVWQKLMSAVFAVCNYKGPKGGFLKPRLELGWLDGEERAKAKAQNIGAVADMLSKLEQDGVISKKQYAETIMIYAAEGRLSLTFAPEHLRALELDEEQTILQNIKELGSKKRDSAMGSGSYRSSIPSMAFEEEEGSNPWAEGGEPSTPAPQPPAEPAQQGEQGGAEPLPEAPEAGGE